MPLHGPKGQIIGHVVVGELPSVTKDFSTNTCDLQAPATTDFRHLYGKRRFGD